MTDRKAYHAEYLSKLKEIRFRVKPLIGALQAAAKEQGYGSLRQFFLAAIREKMEGRK